MAEEENDTVPPNTASFASPQTPARPSQSPLRQRSLGRASTFSEAPGPSNIRRSSTFSDSISEARQSIFSSTDDLLVPKVKNSGIGTNHEPSHWHSVPLALALLPAVGGLLFQNGSAVVTDVTLLGLAAVFLNWSVRLPWDWYFSAQSRRPTDPQSSSPTYTDSAILEESSSSNHTTPGASPSAEQKASTSPNRTPSRPPTSPRRPSAVTELRIHELLALLACFVSPLLGAMLLHTIRAQLSRPSEGLVSNYNLTIFLLAAELRPLSHLIKLIQARTLHLQRTISPTAPSKSSDSAITPSTIADLTARLDDLEAHIASAASKPPTKSDVSHLITQIRHSLQPDIDALTRAVRRYEKRATLLSMQTESRLQDLEARMSDAITLAAAAERNNQQLSRRGSFTGILLNSASAAVVLPVRAVWAVVSWPGRVVGAMVGYAEMYVGKKVRREMRTAGKGGSGNGKGGVGGGGSGSGHDRRGKERAPGRGTKKVA